jgi:hypothetical protein
MEAEIVATEPQAPAIEPSIAEPVDPHKGTVSEIRQAAQRLAARRTELKAERAAAQESAPLAEESPPQEGDAAPAEEQISGETEAVDPAPVEEPSIDPPRSWTMEDKETFRALPRETQARLVDLDRARELEVRKVQNEIAEQRKGFESEQQAMVQARQQYENALPLILQQMQTSGEFADIKTIEDVKNLANTDWPRYVQWDAHSKMLAAMQQEIEHTQQRQQQEQASEWQSYSAKEDAAFRDKVPDADSLRQPAIDYLKDVGFADNEIGEYWNSKAWRDHRMQSVIADAVRYRQAKAKAAVAQKAPLPPVLKPGVAQARPAPFSAEIKALEAKGSLNLREAARLSQLRRARA